MLVALLVLATGPIYWFLVPARFRKDFLTLLSLLGLGLIDPRLPLVLLVVVGLLYGCTQAMSGATAGRRRALLWFGFAGLLALFLYNKLSVLALSFEALPAQRGLVFLGVSYVVLKAVAILIEARRESLGPATFRDLLRWIVFLPIYPSGPIEDFKHFVAQEPRVDQQQILVGLERILFGLVKALVIGRAVGEWAMPFLLEPGDAGPLLLFTVAIALTVRVYFDFSGYSDVAIGLAALFGYEIQENFNYPMFQRNIGLLWQSWHMTLTRWLRLYCFIPVSRRLMRRGPRWDGVAVVAGHLWALSFCAFWHGFQLDFLIWAALQAAGLIWIGLGVRPAGARMPAAFLAWWRRSRVAYALGCAMAVSYFSLVNVLMMADASVTFAFFGRLLGVG